MTEPLMKLISPPGIGTKYHVSWGKSNGVVGKCVSVDEVNKTVIMKSPKTGIHWKSPVKWDDLRYLRKQQALINTIEGNK